MGPIFKEVPVVGPVVDEHRVDVDHPRLQGDVIELLVHLHGEPAVLIAEGGVVEMPVQQDRLEPLPMSGGTGTILRLSGLQGLDRKSSLSRKMHVS